MRACAFWRKPDGLFVIRPAAVGGFLAPLPVARLPGVGTVMEQKPELKTAEFRTLTRSHTAGKRAATAPVA